jgi:hypothetical protein
MWSPSRVAVPDVSATEMRVGDARPGFTMPTSMFGADTERVSAPPP